jgi:methylglutaconyl-CoA hydratase
MSDAVVLYEVRKSAAWITLNRPDQRNALSAELVNQLYAGLETANADPAVRVLVLTGAGPAFCSGADLKSPPGSVAGAAGRSYGLPDILMQMLDGKPVVCAINGSAFAGGLGLVGASDIAITREDAEFSFSEVRIGVIPAIISVVCIPKIGRHNAMRLFLTGERFNGREAVSYGLAHKAVPADELLAAVDAELDVLRLGGPEALRGCKELVRKVPTWSIERGFAETAPWSVRHFKSDEGLEGMAAFREKRKPKWVEEG